MKTRMILIVCAVAFFMLGATCAYCIVKEEAAPQKTVPGGPAESKAPEYVPGQLIVKFKPEMGAKAAALLKEAGASTSMTSANTLGNLNRKHGIKTMRPLFKPEIKGTAEGKALVDKLKQRARRASPGAKKPDLENIYILELDNPKADMSVVADEYRKDPNVVYAEPNYKVEAMMRPNDPYYSTSGSWGQSYDDLWGLKRSKLNCEDAWNVSQGQGVLVAVIDSGVDYKHEDFADRNEYPPANIWINKAEIPNNGIDDDQNGKIDDVMGWDFVGAKYYSPAPDNDPMDGYGHGTHVAGTIAARGNNNRGIIGVAPQAKIMAVKGLDDKGYGNIADLANALEYAAANGADVINCSWGCQGSSQTITEAVNAAYALGCVIVAAAGNSYNDAMLFSPASIPNVITVSAFDQNDQMCSFSNFGAKIDVSAPGGAGGIWWGADLYNILSLLAPNSYFATNAAYSKYIVGAKYLRLAGTSMASPHVAGLAALVLSRHPEFTNEDVRQAIRSSADEVGSPGFDLESGFGRINAQKALAVDSILRAIITSPYGALDPTATSITITGTAAGTGFMQYELSYTTKDKLGNWIPIGPSVARPVENGPLGAWDISKLPAGTYLLRLTAAKNDGSKFQTVTQVYREKNVSQISDSLTDKRFPAISGNKIVWLDLRNGRRDIYLYDLITNTERRITNNMANPGGSPAISGDKIIWMDYRNGGVSIYLYDLMTSSERQITGNTAKPMNPKISGSNIVWEDYRNGAGGGDIFLYDLIKNTERKIAANGASSYPAISGDKIVWAERSNTIYNIYLYDLTKNTRRQITNNTSASSGTCLGEPAISGNKIVWVDRNSNPIDNVYIYDLTTNTQRQIITNKAVPHYPTISGDKIVGSDFSGYGRDVYFYDLAANTGCQVSANAYLPNQGIPNISDNNVVWDENRTGIWSIYMCKLPKITPPKPPIVYDEGAFTMQKGRLYASWIFSDPGSGVSEYQYRITQDTSSGAVIRDWTSTGTSNNVTAEPLNLEDGKTYYFQVKAKTDNGLWSGIGHSNGITVDATPPIGNILINNGAPSTTSPTVTLNLLASDTGSGMGKGAQMQFSYGDAPWSVPEPYQTTKSWTLSPATNGPKTVYAKFRDAVGNWSVTYAATIKLDIPDTTPPAGSILINDGAPATATPKVILNLSASDSGSGMGEGARMQFSNDNTTWSASESYQTTKQWTLAPATNGPKTVYAKFRDAAGNWSAALKSSIILQLYPYTIMAHATAKGVMIPSGRIYVGYGDSQEFKMTPDAGYHVEDVRVDGKSVGAVSTYAFTNVTDRHNILARFARNTYKITVTEGANGSISPSGSSGIVTVHYGENRRFVIKARINYRIADVLVDGVSRGAVSSYIFSDVKEDHTISARFIKK